MFKNTIVTSFFLILSSVFGFIAQLLYANFFGTSLEIDVYFKILSIPSILSGMLPVLFTFVLFPIFAKIEKDLVYLKSFINNVYNFVFFSALIFSCIGFLVVLFRILYLGDFQYLDYIFIVEISFLVWFGAGFFMISNFLLALLNFEKQFFKVALISILPPILIILCIIFFHNYLGVISIALGGFLANVIQFVFIYFNINRKYTLTLFKFNKNSQDNFVLAKVVLVIFSLLPYTLISAISYYFASFLNVGSISILGYSQSFAGFLSVATGMGIAIVSFPDSAKDLAVNNLGSAMNKFETSLKFVLLFSIIIASAFISFRYKILHFFYSSDSFPSKSIDVFASVIPFYLISAIFTAGLNLIRTFFFSQNRYKIMAVFGILIPVFFIGLTYVLIFKFSIYGIALANLIALLILFFCMIFLLKTKDDKYLWCRILVFIFTNSIIAFLSGFFSNKIGDVINNKLNDFTCLIFCLMIFTVFYFIVSRYVFKLSEILKLEKIVINQLNKIFNY
jgi:putative peptidoglycan lipid II flippase